MKINETYRVISYLLVMLAGAFITGALHYHFGYLTQDPFWTKEFPGMWLGPMLTGWVIGQMMAREKVL